MIEIKVQNHKHKSFWSIEYRFLTSNYTIVGDNAGMVRTSWGGKSPRGGADAWGGLAGFSWGGLAGFSWGGLAAGLSPTELEPPAL